MGTPPNVEGTGWQGTRLKPRENGVVELDLVLADVEVGYRGDIAGFKSRIEYEDVLAAISGQDVSVSAGESSPANARRRAESVVFSSQDPLQSLVIAKVELMRSRHDT